MSQTVILRWAGLESGDAASAIYDQVHPTMMGLTEKHPGMVAHTCSKTDDGIVIVDVWESGEQWQAFMDDPAARGAMEAAGMTAPASVEILDTHNTEGL